MLTLVDLADRMKHLDEVTLLEVLDIKSDELTDRFLDKIEERFDHLSEELEDIDIWDDLDERE